MKLFYKILRKILSSPEEMANGIFIYIFFTIPCFMTAAIIWGAVAVDKLFVCTDSMGPFDFIPPFVHSTYGDHYVASASFVWMLWTVFIILTFGLPALVTKSFLYIFRKRDRDDNKELLF